MTKDAIMNALTVDMALGCSTNSMLHLPAIAHEIGWDFDITFANEVSAKTPNLCHLAPAGPTYIEDLNEAGGVYAVMNELTKKDLLNLDEYPLIWQLIFWIDQPQHFGTIRRLGRITLLPQLRDIPQ